MCDEIIGCFEHWRARRLGKAKLVFLRKCYPYYQVICILLKLISELTIAHIEKSVSKLLFHQFNINLGVLLGIAIRSGNPLSLSLAEPIWKLLVGSKLQIDDLKDIDRVFVTKYSYLMTLGKGDQFEDRSNIKEPTVEELELPFSVRTASGKDFMLSPKHAFVTTENKSEYLRSALQYKLQEFDRQICWVRSGLSQTIPVPILSLFTGAELENMVCGNPDIPVEAFKSITTYRGVEPLAPLVKWFWHALEEFTNHERSLFLRFVWGRTRLPRTAIDFKGKDFIFQVTIFIVYFLKFVLKEGAT